MEKEQCTTTYGVRRQGGPVSASLIKTLPSTRANHHSESSCVFTVFYHPIRCSDKNPLADRHKLNKTLSPPPPSTPRWAPTSALRNKAARPPPPPTSPLPPTPPSFHPR